MLQPQVSYLQPLNWISKAALRPPSSIWPSVSFQRASLWQPSIPDLAWLYAAYALQGLTPPPAHRYNIYSSRVSSQRARSHFKAPKRQFLSPPKTVVVTSAASIPAVPKKRTSTIQPLSRDTTLVSRDTTLVPSPREQTGSLRKGTQTIAPTTEKQFLTSSVPAKEPVISQPSKLTERKIDQPVPRTIQEAKTKLISPTANKRTVTPAQNIPSTQTFVRPTAVKEITPKRTFQRAGEVDSGVRSQQHVVEYVKKQTKSPSWRSTRSLPKSATIEKPSFVSAPKQQQSFVKQPSNMQMEVVPQKRATSEITPQKSVRIRQTPVWRGEVVRPKPVTTVSAQEKIPRVLWTKKESALLESRPFSPSQVPIVEQSRLKKGKRDVAVVVPEVGMTSVPTVSSTEPTKPVNKTSYRRVPQKPEWQSENVVPVATNIRPKDVASPSVNRVQTRKTKPVQWSSTKKAVASYLDTKTGIPKTVAIEKKHVEPVQPIASSPQKRKSERPKGVFVPQSPTWSTPTRDEQKRQKRTPTETFPARYLSSPKMRQPESSPVTTQPQKTMAEKKEGYQPSYGGYVRVPQGLSWRLERTERTPRESSSPTIGSPRKRIQPAAIQSLPTVSPRAPEQPQSTQRGGQREVTLPKGAPRRPTERSVLTAPKTAKGRPSEPRSVISPKPQQTTGIAPTDGGTQKRMASSTEQPERTQKRMSSSAEKPERAQKRGTYRRPDPLPRQGRTRRVVRVPQGLSWCR